MTQLAVNMLAIHRLSDGKLLEPLHETEAKSKLYIQGYSNPEKYQSIRVKILPDCSDMQEWIDTATIEKPEPEYMEDSDDVCNSGVEFPQADYYRGYMNESLRRAGQTLDPFRLRGTEYGRSPGSTTRITPVDWYIGPDDEDESIASAT